MKKTNIAFILFTLFAFASSVVYAAQLKFGFEPPYGFAVISAPLYAVIICCAVFAALCGIYCAKIKYPKSDVLPTSLLFSESSISSILACTGFVLIVAGGICGFFSAFQNLDIVYILVLVLAIISAFIIFILASAQRKGAFESSHYIMCIVPTVCLCVELVSTFKQNISNPVILSFAFELFAVLFLMLALYGYSALFFLKNRIRRFVFISLYAFFMVIMCTVGKFIIIFLDRTQFNMLSVSESFILLGFAVFALGMAYAVKRNLDLRGNTDISDGI